MRGLRRNFIGFFPIKNHYRLNKTLLVLCYHQNTYGNIMFMSIILPANINLGGALTRHNDMYVDIQNQWD